MYGKWSQWNPIPNLPGKLYMENLAGSWGEGLEITLKTSDDSQGIKITFGAASVISYQCTDEGKRLKTQTSQINNLSQALKNLSFHTIK